MYARLESFPSAGHPRLDPRLVGGRIAATLVIGVIAGYLAATLSVHSPSAVVSRAPGAAVSAPSTGVYGDRDSRLPIANNAVTSPAGDLCDRNSCGSLNLRPSTSVNNSNVGRSLVPNSVIPALDSAHAAVTSTANGFCDRNSCGLYLPGSLSALDRANAARVAALQGLAGVDWSASAGEGYGVRDSRPPLAPFKLR
jgi:hypothetical protein